MSHILNKFLPPYACSVAVTAAIIYLTLFPEPLPPDTPALFQHADKVVHAIMFWAFFTSVAVDMLRQRLKRHKPVRLSRSELTVIFIASSLFGLAIEIAQWAMQLGRGADALDFLADSAGAAAAWLSLRLVKRLVFPDKATAEV